MKLVMGVIIICIFLWVLKTFLRKASDPPGKDGTMLRFREYVANRNMEGAQKIALSLEEPYRTRLLKEAFGKFTGDRSEYALFTWLKELPPDLRERVAPGAFTRYGIKDIKEKLELGDSYVWVLASQIGYEFSTSELKTLAKKGDQRAIKKLDK